MPTIETARLLLRQFTPDDLDALVPIYSDTDVMKYINDGIPLTREQTNEFLNSYITIWKEHGFGRWAMVHKATGELIGFCGFAFLDRRPQIEIGYRLAKAYWGMGLVSEAARACLDYGFEHFDFQRVVAVVRPENIASQRVLEKLGMTYEHTGQYYKYELKYYAVTKEAYEQCKQQLPKL